MAKHDDISSTERLLDLIRGKKNPDVAPSDFPPTPSGSAIKSFFTKTPFFTKVVTVGVDIGRRELKLVKINQFSGKKQELLDYRRVSFDSDISKDSPQFSRLLKSALTSFCGSSTKNEIWSTISSVNVETRYIKIPKLPKKQIANAVYWTFKKEVPFNEKKEIFDFELLRDITEEGVQKTEVICYSAPKQEIKDLKQIFLKSGYTLSGISIVPFALQNLLRTEWIATDGKDICNLFIGSDWSRIAIYSNGNLVLSRDIKAGIKSMIEAIAEEMDNKNAEFSSGAADAAAGPMENGTPAERTQNSTVLAEKIFYSFIHDTPSGIEENVGLDLKDEEVFEIILPALDRVVRQVEKTLRHYSINFANKVVDKIFISGQTSTHRRIVDYINYQLDLPVETIDPLAPAYSTSEAINHEMIPERGAFVPAVGMALSNNSLTPNFIFTYKDKEKFDVVRKINRSIVSVCLLLITLLISISFWQGYLRDKKTARINQLHQQLDRYSPIVDQNLILKAVAKINAGKQSLVDLGEKKLSMAVISEIANITPSNINLIGITAELGGVAGNNQKDKKKFLVLDGIVQGDRLSFESSLADYLVKLKSSPIFSLPSIKSRAVELSEGNREVLRFKAQLELV